MKRKAFLQIFVIAAILAFLFFRQIVGLVTDWWWYQEIQNSAFFLKSVELQMLMFALVFLLLFVPSFFSVFLARRLAPLQIQIVEGDILEYPVHLFRPYLFPLLYGIVGVIAFLAAVQGATNWNLLLPLFAKTPFHQTDPVFHRDLGFYVFYLPLGEYFYQIGMTGFVLAFLITVISYGIQSVLKYTSRGIKLAPVVSTHLSFLLGVLFLLKSFGYRIGMYNLLLTQRGTVFGIGYADAHARIPLLQAAGVLTLLVSLLCFLNAKLHNWKPVVGAGIAWIILSLALFVYPRVIQQFQVLPSELDKEKSFLTQNIRFTQEAYDLSSIRAVRVQPVSLTPDLVKNHKPTLENIRLWDRAPLEKSLAQLQDIRPYYTFSSVDVDRYTIGGELRETMLSVRELDYGRLQNPTWTNSHLIFTHGYGFAATPVNQFTPEGLPTFFVKNIPPSGVPELSVKFPEIYYGESENEYSIVKTKQPEFNYPAGEGNRYTHYSGAGGVPLRSLWRRFLFGFRFSSKIFFSSDVDAGSRILFYRNIRTRLQQAFPLLEYDSDPYPVLSGGRVTWLCDAYTVNDHYPYSHPIEFHDGSYNYIRNAVKVAVDAYNGTVTYYAADSKDPILQLYRKIFPGFFHPLSEMPEDLRKHIRVPEDLFLAQASVYSLYHMTDPDVFYNREDLWQIPRVGEEETIRPYYVIMQIPGDSKPEFVLMLPFTPSRKDNLAAWIGARCDPPHYGEKLVFQFPKENLVFGPAQISARINQDPKFSQLRTLWGQQGSRINLGHLQVIPLGNSILYVQPLYIKAEEKELPELKLVILTYNGRIVMEENLQKGLFRLFSMPEATTAEVATQKAIPGQTEAKVVSSSFRSLLKEAGEHYARAMAAQRAGDWAGYGEEIQKLGTVLEKLRKANP